MFRLILALMGFVLSSLLETVRIPGTPEPDEFKVRDGESADEWKARTARIHERLDRERKEYLEERRKRSAAEDAQDRRSTADGDARRRRAKGQAGEVEKAVSEFETAKGRLYRADGTWVYGVEEHAERLEKLTEELRKKVEAVAEEAARDAEEHDRGALVLSYADPASMVPAADRSRLETSRAFVKEDCESLVVPDLVRRLAAVEAGEDKVAKVLHARYARARLTARQEEANGRAAEGRPAGAARAREDRELREAVAALEAEVADPRASESARAFEKAAQESRRVAREARTRLSRADGSAAAARETTRQAIHGAF